MRSPDAAAPRLFNAKWRGRLHSHRGAAAVGALFLALSLFYNITIPPWEADNEWSHYQYVRYITLNHRLPQPDTQIAVPPSDDLCRIPPASGLTTVHQFRQPPLYYLLSSVVLAGFDAHAEPPFAANPHIRTEHSQDDHNIALHTDQERFPYRGPVLAVHALRLFSGLIGLAGLIAAYLSGLLLFRQRALATTLMAVNAFIPQYVLSSSVISNDILVGALGAWCAFLCLWFLLRRSTPLALGAATLVAGAAIITKYSGLVLLPMIATTLAIALAQSWRREQKRFARRLALTLGGVALASLPILFWLSRNYDLYGHVFGPYADVTSSFAQGVLAPADQVSNGRLLDPWHAAGFAFMTFWGFFASDTLALPHSLVIVLGVVSLAALVGVVLLMRDRQQPVLRMAAPAALLVLVGAFTVNFVKSAGTSEPPGRYFLPVYSTACFLLTAGLHRLLPPRWMRGMLALPTALLILAALIPPLLIRPLYALPLRAASAELHSDEQPVNAVFGNFAELLGYHIEPERIGLFETVRVTLVWRSLQATANNYTIALHLLDGANTPHGWIARFPGRGNYATSLWQSGDVFRDTYTLALHPSARGLLPSLGRIKVSLYCYTPEGDALLPVTNTGGQNLGDSVYIGRLKLADATPPAPTAAPALYRFGDALVLQALTVTPQHTLLGPALQLELQWQASARPARDYTVFAHLDDDNGATVAAFDLPLTGGYYPSDLWDAGEQVTHRQSLPLPATYTRTSYVLRLGVYDPATGERLPVRDAADDAQPSAEIVLGPFTPPAAYNFLPGLEISAGASSSN